MRMDDRRISVFLADDNLIVREGVRALLGAEPDMEVVAVAADRDELVAGTAETAPQVIVTDIRMPPRFQREASMRPRKFASVIGARASPCCRSTTSQSMRSRLVTHDAGVAGAAERIVQMRDGRLVEDPSGAGVEPVAEARSA
jgi:DNA-binding NarL/FixJ family response regulator